MTLDEFNQEFKTTQQGKDLAERIKVEYAQQIAATNTALLSVVKAQINVLEAHGTEKNFYAVFEEILLGLPRHVFIKNYEYDGQKYDVDIDLLTGEWYLG